MTTKVDNDTTCSTQELSAHLGVTPQRIVQYVEKGMPKLGRGSFDLNVACQWVRKYLQDSQKAAQNRSQEVKDFWTEKSKLTAIQAEQASDKLQQTRGRLVNFDDMAPTYDQIIVKMKSNLLGLGSKVTKTLEGKTAPERATIIEKEIRTILTELSNDLGKLVERHG